MKTEQFFYPEMWALLIGTYYYQGKYVQAEQSIEKALGLVERRPGSQTLAQAAASNYVCKFEWSGPSQ